MSAKLEVFLARLYVDAEFRERFLANPRELALQQGLDEGEATSVAAIDKAALKMTAKGLRKKAEARNGRKESD